MKWTALAPKQLSAFHVSCDKLPAVCQILFITKQQAVEVFQSSSCTLLTPVVISPRDMVCSYTLSQRRFFKYVTISGAWWCYLTRVRTTECGESACWKHQIAAPSIHPSEAKPASLIIASFLSASRQRVASLSHDGGSGSLPLRHCFDSFSVPPRELFGSNFFFLLSYSIAFRRI